MCAGNEVSCIWQGNLVSSSAIPLPDTHHGHRTPTLPLAYLPTPTLFYSVFVSIQEKRSRKTTFLKTVLPTSESHKADASNTNLHSHTHSFQGKPIHIKRLGAHKKFPIRSVNDVPRAAVDERHFRQVESRPRLVSQVHHLTHQVYSLPQTT